MATKRYEVYEAFKHYVQDTDERNMDEICAMGPEDEFRLQAQQLFLRDYMRKFPKWRSLLLYHQIGSGKTCTAITMAEEHVRLYPGHKVRVILPARLRTNFIDELISPCGMEKYLSKENYEKFHSPGTSVAAKKRITASFNKAIRERYDIMSFERLRLLAMTNKYELATWIRAWTKDSLIVIDEVHNLLSDKYDVQKARAALTTGRVESKSVKGFNTVLLKMLAKFAHPNTKMVCLTATPIFDNVSQFKELVRLMNPELMNARLSDLRDAINHLRGKVSYFPGTSTNAYPAVKYDIHEVKLSATQQNITLDIIDGNEGYDGDEMKESFMSGQRQVSLACLPDNEPVSQNIGEVLDNMKENCPKIKKLLELIAKRPGKHVVFSNFVQSGLRIVEEALRRAGWKSLQEVAGNAEAWAVSRGKVYAAWDGSVTDAEKQQIKSIVNSKDNIFGYKLRVILGSPSIREGVSFKHVQQLHILDPVWNQSAKTQIEGRAIRLCSHVDIDEKLHKPLVRKVVVNIYKSVARKMITRSYITCDQVIYDRIIVSKQRDVAIGEEALKKVAIDHYLFQNMYASPKVKTLPKRRDSASSDLGIPKEHLDTRLSKERIKRKINTCPKKRRPNPESGCPPGTLMRLNKQDHECCYKIRGKST